MASGFTRAQAKDIIFRYRVDGETYTDIGNDYGVTYGTIRNIVLGRTQFCIDGELDMDWWEEVTTELEATPTRAPGRDHNYAANYSQSIFTMQDAYDILVAYATEPNASLVTLAEQFDCAAASIDRVLRNGVSNMKDGYLDDAWWDITLNEIRGRPDIVRWNVAWDRILGVIWLRRKQAGISAPRPEPVVIEEIQPLPDEPVEEIVSLDPEELEAPGPIIINEFIEEPEELAFQGKLVMVCPFAKEKEFPAELPADEEPDPNYKEGRGWFAFFPRAKRAIENIGGIVRTN